MISLDNISLIEDLNKVRWILSLDNIYSFRHLYKHYTNLSFEVFFLHE